MLNVHLIMRELKMIKLKLPALAINEFEMAVDTGCMSIIGSCDNHLTQEQFGMLLLKRIGEFRAPPMATLTIVREGMPDPFVNHDRINIAKILDSVFAGFTVNVRTRISVHISANGYEEALRDLLPTPIQPFQVFTTDGAPLKTRISRATDGSAAYDIFAKEDLEITKEARLIGLGFKSRMDYRQAAMLLPRSGLGAKWGFALANTIGLIDSDFPDEWKGMIYLHDIPGVNVEGETLKIPAGERLVQFVIVNVEHPVMEQVEDEADLRPTGRVGGFGSTNVHLED